MKLDSTDFCKTVLINRIKELLYIEFNKYTFKKPADMMQCIQRIQLIQFYEESGIKNIKLIPTYDGKNTISIKVIFNNFEETFDIFGQYVYNPQLK